MDIIPKKIYKKICNQLSNIPFDWDGKSAILEMKNKDGRNWKQMEWIGWYFEFLCNHHLQNIMEMPFRKKYGNVSFDGFLIIPWDFKTHAIESGTKIIVNDSQAISQAINEFGAVGLILAEGKVTYDDEVREFQKWHEILKGGKSQYEYTRITRNAPSRKRKKNMKINRISLIRIDEELLVKCGTFQENFRNSNGNVRRKKILLDLTKIENNIEYVLERDNSHI